LITVNKMLFTLLPVIWTAIAGAENKKNRLQKCSRFFMDRIFNPSLAVMMTLKLFRRLLFRLVKLELDTVDKRLIGGFYDVVRNTHGPPSAFLVA
jgi:hypothetical protein